MTPESKVRVVIFVPVDMAARCAELAERHRASRSEVYRLAIERGLRDVRPALKRLERARPANYRPARGGGSPKQRAARAARHAAPDGAYASLSGYGRSFLSVSPGCDREDARVALEAQAKVLDLDGPDGDAIVDQVLGELFTEEAGTGAEPQNDGAVLPPD